MNFWDPESASCDVPQDDFDSERESTLVYNATGEDSTAEEDYAVGRCQIDGIMNHQRCLRGVAHSPLSFYYIYLHHFTS